MLVKKQFKKSLWLPTLLSLTTLQSVHGASPVIVITPTRIATDMTQSTIAVDVISREQIEQSPAQDVADIIKFHSGIEIARNGGSGQVTSLFMRGAESNHTVILIDGVKINPATIGSAALQNIAPSIIDHIEIVKGPRSSLYGSEAIGGVINIITRKAIQGRHGSLTLGAGDNGRRHINLDAGYGKGAFSGGLTLDRYSTDGYPVNDASSQDDGYDNDTLNAFANYKGLRHTVNLRHWQSRGNVEYYSFGEQNQDYSNSASTLQWDASLSTRLSSSLTLSKIEDNIEQQVANYLMQFDYAKTIRDALDIKLDYQLATQTTLSAGISKSKEQVDALSYGSLIDANTDIDEVYLLAQTSVGDHQATVSMRNTRHEDFGSHNTWNIDYRYKLQPDVHIYAAAGTAFRAPDNTDRFGYGGNPNLDPETSRNRELGLIMDLSAGSQFKLAAFNNRIDDLIEISGAWPNQMMQNVDAAQIKGIEISFNQQLPHWRYQFNAVLQDARNLTNAQKLSRRADSTINILLGYQQGQWDFSTATSLVSARDNSSYDDIILQPYALTDFSTQYQLARNASLRLKVDNLFNEHYETAAGFNNRERSLLMEMSWRW